MSKWKEPFENALLRAIETEFSESALKEVISYSLESGGKRLRPLLLLEISQSEKGMPAAIALEFCHTASLIADDLPCMDNDFYRRGRPTVHRAFSENAALLASYALIASSYNQVRICFESLLEGNNGLLNQGILLTSHATGAFGLTGGQFLDLSPDKILSFSMYEKIAYQKTGALFELAFALGWLVRMQSTIGLEKAQEFGRLLGICYQLFDDWQDYQSDDKQGALNGVVLFGENVIAKRIEELQKGLLKSPLYEKQGELVHSLIQSLTPQFTLKN